MKWSTSVSLAISPVWVVTITLFQIIVSQPPPVSFWAPFFPECERFNLSLLGDWDWPSTRGLVGEKLVEETTWRYPNLIGLDVSLPLVQILAANITCESHGRFRGTSSSVSVLVRYSCMGTACIAATHTITTIFTHHFTFRCRILPTFGYDFILSEWGLWAADSDMTVGGPDREDVTIRDPDYSIEDVPVMPYGHCSICYNVLTSRDFFISDEFPSFPDSMCRGLPNIMVQIRYISEGHFFC